jgi:hypothetical protein
MVNTFDILASGYAASIAPTSPFIARFSKVDPKAYQGSWTGSYPDNTKFQLQISNVQGFRAQVKYQNGATVQVQQVLIGNNAFSIGDTRFVLAGKGVARVATVITNPADGSTKLITGVATQSA